MSSKQQQPAQPKTKTVAVGIDDEIKAFWPNGAGYELYKIDDNCRPIHVGTYEGTHDGNVEKTS